MKQPIKIALLVPAVCGALLVPPTNAAHAVDCHAAGYPAGTGCVGLPPEFGISDAEAAQVKAWSKCLAGITAAAIPYAKGVKKVAEKIKSGAPVVGLVGYSTCDLDAIRGK